MTGLNEKLDKIESDYKLRKETAVATYCQELAQADQGYIQAKVQFGHDYLVQNNLMDQDMMSLVKSLTDITGDEDELQQMADEAGRQADEYSDQAYEAYNRRDWKNIAIIASPAVVAFVGLVSYGIYNFEMPEIKTTVAALTIGVAASFILSSGVVPKEGMQEAFMLDVKSGIQEDRKLELGVQQASLPFARDVIQAFRENDPAHLGNKDDYERNNANLDMMDAILRKMAGSGKSPQIGI